MARKISEVLASDPIGAPATSGVASAAIAMRDSGNTTVSPSDSVDRVVEIMQREAIRSLPVMEGERPVGIVSLCDLTVGRAQE
jgi:CBS domain-containing protein